MLCFSSAPFLSLNFSRHSSSNAQQQEFFFCPFKTPKLGLVWVCIWVCVFLDSQEKTLYTIYGNFLIVHIAFIEFKKKKLYILVLESKVTKMYIWKKKNDIQ